TVLVCVMHGARHLGNQFRRLANRHRRAPDYFVELTAFNELHAEVALAIALAHFVDGNDAWMLKVGSGLFLPSEALQLRFGDSGTAADYFERHTAIETLLMGAINYALTATADFREQFIVAKIAKDSYRLRAFLSGGCQQAILTTGVSDPGYSILI